MPNKETAKNATGPSRHGVTPYHVRAIAALAKEHLSKAKTEHGFGHALEVEKLALDCLPDGADPFLCQVIALLHDCDDWKQFPDPDGDVPNSIRIMAAAGLPEGTVQLVREELRCFGFTKRLKGLSPRTPEGQAASDADMLTLLGASGILRLAQYNAIEGLPFFDPEDAPDPGMTHDSYVAARDVSGVRHLFDKVLKLPRYMLTEEGKVEAYLRRNASIRFLDALFREQDAPEWTGRLTRFLEEEKD